MLSNEIVWRLAVKPMTIRELCETTGRTRQQLHEALQRLQADGYVESEPAPADGKYPRPTRLRWKTTQP